MDITNIEKKEDHTTVTMPFHLYVKAYSKAIRKNPKAKTMTVSITLPLSNRVNAFRSDPHRVRDTDKRYYGPKAWMLRGGRGYGVETISIPLTAAGRAAKRKEHNAPKREAAEENKRRQQAWAVRQASTGK